VLIFYNFYVSFEKAELSIKAITSRLFRPCYTIMNTYYEHKNDNGVFRFRSSEEYHGIICENSQKSYHRSRLDLDKKSFCYPIR
jgi:hypothetical protein